MALSDIINQHNSSIVSSDKPKDTANASLTKGPSTLVIIDAWKKNPRKQYSEQLLKRMNSVIRSAINTYCPGVPQQTVRIPAAKLVLDALKSFDPQRGAAPTTHVFNSLKRLSRIGTQRSSVIHTPENARFMQAQIARASADLQDMLDRQPTLQQLSDAVGIPAQKLTQQMQRTRQISQSALTPAQSTFSRQRMAGQTDKDYMNYVYDSVGPQDKKIIQWSTGLYGKPILSNMDIAKKLKISAPAVSQRKAKIITMLENVRASI